MKHPLRWFKHRIGREIYTKLDLFHPPIKIHSEGHAKGLHASQDKGHRYHETKPPSRL